MNISKRRNSELLYGLSHMLRDWAFGISFFLIIVLATNISIPFFPVPFTLQTFAIPLICLFAHSRKQVLYGLFLFVMYRIFTEGTLFLMTGGYIFGFFITAYLLTRPGVKGSLYTVAKNVFFCLSLELFLGSIWLTVFLSPAEAVRCGFLFFVPAEIIKFVSIVSVYGLIKNFSHKTER